MGTGPCSPLIKRGARSNKQVIRLTFRTSLQICPHWIRNVKAIIHSSVLRRVSRAKS